MTRRIRPFWIGILVISLLSATACSVLSAQERVVVLVDESGPQARVGRIVRNAAEMTVNRYSSSAPRRAGINVVLRHIDYGGNPATAEDQLRRVLGERGSIAAVIGPVDSETAFRVAPLLRRSQVPLLCPIPLAPSSSGRMRDGDVEPIDGLLQLAASLPQQLIALVDAASLRLDGQRVGLVYGGSSWRWAADLFRRRARERGLSVAFVTELRPGARPPDPTSCDVMIIAADRDPGLDVAAWGLGSSPRPRVLLVSPVLVDGPTSRVDGAIVAMSGSYDPSEPAAERFARFHELDYARLPGETVVLTRDALALISRGNQALSSIRRGSFSPRGSDRIRGFSGDLRFEGTGRRDIPVHLMEVRGRNLRPLGPAVTTAEQPATVARNVDAAQPATMDGSFDRAWWDDPPPSQPTTVPPPLQRSDPRAETPRRAATRSTDRSRQPRRMATRPGSPVERPRIEEDEGAPTADSPWWRTDRTAVPAEAPVERRPPSSDGRSTSDDDSVPWWRTVDETSSASGRTPFPSSPSPRLSPPAASSPFGERATDSFVIPPPPAETAPTSVPSRGGELRDDQRVPAAFPMPSPPPSGDQQPSSEQGFPFSERVSPPNLNQSQAESPQESSDEDLPWWRSIPSPSP